MNTPTHTLKHLQPKRIVHHQMMDGCARPAFASTAADLVFSQGSLQVIQHHLQVPLPQPPQAVLGLHQQFSRTKCLCSDVTDDDRVPP